MEQTKKNRRKGIKEKDVMIDTHKKYKKEKKTVTENRQGEESKKEKTVYEGGE